VCVRNDDWTPPFCRDGKFPQGLAIGIDRCKVACAARPKCKAISIAHPTRGTAAECYLVGEVNDQDNPVITYPNVDFYDIEEVCEPATESPTEEPTNEPTFKPSLSPTTEPTQEPSLSPTSEPSLKPSSSPTIEPTKCTVKYTRHRGMTRLGHRILMNDDLIPTDPVCVRNDDWTPPFCRDGKFPQGLAIGIDRCKVACAARPKCKAISIAHPTRGTAAECYLVGEVNDQDNPVITYPNVDFYDIEEVCEPACPALKCTVHCDTGYVIDVNGCETCECQPQVWVQSTGICAPHHAPGTGLPVDLPLDLDQCKSLCDNHPSCTSFHYAYLSGPQHNFSHRCVLKSTSRGCTAQEQQVAEQFYRDLGLGCCLDKSCPNNQYLHGAIGASKHNWICFDTWTKAQFMPIERRQLTGRLLSESNSV